VADVTETRSARGLLTIYGLATLLALFAYFFGLDSQHVPKNGDEYPYEHITRITAASGHWLPLQSEIQEFRNTKPPMLFWQGITSTRWGTDWSLWSLRWPSVIYTLLTAIMAFVLGWRLSGRLDTGFIALLTYLAFFSTYRYGRPFLTDAPSVFWLFLPCFAALILREKAFESRLLAPLVLGTCTGVALLYKSFALLLPVGLWLAWCYLRRRRYQLAAFLAHDAGKLALLGIVALAIFSLWFLLDPDPRAILAKFVFEENVGKFSAQSGYLTNFFWGGSSIWRLVVSYPINAGLLIFPIVALFLLSFRRRAMLTDDETLLWMWVVALFVVFSLPSQRDERYLLPAMPALAVLAALNWERINRHAFTASLVLTGVATLALGYLSLRLEQQASPGPLYSLSYWGLLIATLSVIGISLANSRLTRPLVNIAILLGFLTFAAFFRPFDGARGSYPPEVQAAVKGRTVWVPTNFAAREEGHRFLLPGADVRPYPLNANLTAAELASQYSLFAMRVPMNAPDLTIGNVLGQRLDVATRQTSSQIVEMLRGRVFEYLFVKETLVDVASRPATQPIETRE
jgi:4-amino-4-deoxy-L-arabinose transferase-like glycosyltransferase